jgi:pimeloyl-ACP methyl ester carboxylesterase
VSEARNGAPREAWDVEGPEDGPAIVFAHGAVMTRAQWRPQVEQLAKAGYRCITLDLPGHGTLAEEAFTLDRASDLIAEAIDREAAGRAVLVGLSLGGYVSMAVAGRSPGRVRGLVLAGSTREPVGPFRFVFSLVALALRLIPEPILRGTIERWYRRRYGRAVADAILANGYYARGGSVAIRQLHGGRFRERLIAYGGPVLVINGHRDLVMRMGERRFTEGLPGVTTMVLRRAAHLSNVDRPGEFSAAIRAFVDGLEA